MRFNYTIEAPKHAGDGGGTLRDTTEITASIWPCSPAPCGGGSGTQQEATPPRTTGTRIAAENDPAWSQGETVSVEIDWNENVTVTGTPRVTLTLDPGGRTADYASGSGSSTLTFEYEIGKDDGTVYSALLTGDSLELNGGTIRDADGTDAVLDHDGAGRAYNAPRSTPTPPRTTGASIDAQSDSSWKPDDKVKVRIDWNEDVTVSGKPTVDLTLDGGTERTATYTSGTGTSQLVFEHEIDGDSWVYSVKLETNSLALAGGSIRDGEGTDAELNHAGQDRAYTPPAPLTVSWTAPDEHDGQTFRFEIEFSDKPEESYSYRTLRDRNLQASGGRVANVRRLNPETAFNLRWEATIEPDTTTSDVGLSLGATEECGSANAICTEDGRKLTNSLSKTVAGPAGISVDDAEVEESEDAEVTFTIRLSKAATTNISVDYATENGTATSGDDYTATDGTVTFAVGDTIKTVGVDVLDDDHDEGSEHFKLVLSNPSGGVISDAEGTGTIKNRDPLPRALLARFGRAAAVHVVEQIQARIEAPRNPATSVRFAGHDVAGLSDAGNAAGLLQSIASAYGVDGAQTMTAGYGAAGATRMPVTGHLGIPTVFQSGTSRGPGIGGGGRGLPAGIGSAGAGPGAVQRGHRESQVLHRANPLARSEFAINRATRDGGSIAFWSRTAESTFSGRAGDVAVNGNVRTTMFGADYAKDQLILGLSVGRSFGDGAYQRRGTGATDTSVVGIYPWIGYKVSEKTTVWGVSGYGRGRLVLSPERGNTLTSPMGMRMHAVGVQRQLTGDDAGVGLTWNQGDYGTANR